MMTRDWPWSPTPSTGRQWAASGLRRASQALARVARVLGRRRAGPTRAPVLEFYAEAGAPEGALYVDGLLVGHLPGVTRL
jgi:hypothetical protein